MKTDTHDTDINTAWDSLFRASPELLALLRRQPAQVIDFQRFKETREICYRRSVMGEGEKHVCNEETS